MTTKNFRRKAERTDAPRAVIQVVRKSFTIRGKLRNAQQFKQWRLRLQENKSLKFDKEPEHKQKTGPDKNNEKTCH